MSNDQVIFELGDTHNLETFAVTTGPTPAYEAFARHRPVSKLSTARPIKFTLPKGCEPDDPDASRNRAARRKLAKETRKRKRTHGIRK